MKRETIKKNQMGIQEFNSKITEMKKFTRGTHDDI